MYLAKVFTFWIERIDDEQIRSREWNHSIMSYPSSIDFMQIGM